MREKKGDFFFRCEWANLYLTRSMIETCTLLTEAGDAWAMHYMELDKGCGRQRYWYTDIGVKRHGEDVVVSVHTSYARNTEHLSGDRAEPAPTVPKVVRYLLRGNKAYCGRPEFRLIEKPLRFDTVGQGKVLAEFIASPERRYPLIVFNGSGEAQVKEARKLAWDVAGKSQVVIVATNQDLVAKLAGRAFPRLVITENALRIAEDFHDCRCVEEAWEILRHLQSCMWGLKHVGMRTGANRGNGGGIDQWDAMDGWGVASEGHRGGAETGVSNNCQRLLTRCQSTNRVCLTNPSRLSSDRRTRTGALFSGGLA
ncbi:MAG TPA: hypothetical protein P5555_05155 [Candidatus Paceibacterota bacterium]|nr:hypothetical protein [Verrucomicrobiota bacterium]HRZ44560.1 hypothetical protein [Candidatus Paceibacterota bacterium]